MGESGTYTQVSELIRSFQRGFDDHDWEGLRACLDDEVFVDYSSFRGTDPSRVHADEYVRSRRKALAGLEMQHSHSNLVVSSRSDGRMSAKCDYRIKRFERGGDGYFHSWGRYDFSVVRRRTGWKICSIVQHLQGNEGDPQIHGGLRPSSEGEATP